MLLARRGLQNVYHELGDWDSLNYYVARLVEWQQLRKEFAAAPTVADGEQLHMDMDTTRIVADVARLTMESKTVEDQ